MEYDDDSISQIFTQYCCWLCSSKSIQWRFKLIPQSLTQYLVWRVSTFLELILMNGPHQAGVIGLIWPDSVCDVAWDTWPGQLRYNIITIIETNRPSQQGGADNDSLLYSYQGLLKMYLKRSSRHSTIRHNKTPVFSHILWVLNSLKNLHIWTP